MIGQTISHYKILEKLGGGGMGVVYKAEDTKLKRIVALKFLPPELTRDEEAKQRFVHEAQAASALQHNNICVVHDIDETPDGQLFISMEYLEGETLKKRMERGPLKIEETTDLAIQIAQGVAEAHAHGIVHRDIKPANVLITKSGAAKIVDFGLAKLTGATKLTKTGSTLGTVAYMSPEQLQDSAVDARADIFSFGVLLHEMLTGKLPFRGDHEAALMYSIINEEPEPLQQFIPDVSSELIHIVSRALEKSPADRYKTMDDLLIDLRRLRKETSKVSIPTHGKGSGVREFVRRRGIRWVLVALAAIASGAVLYLYLGRGPRINPNMKMSTLNVPFEGVGWANFSYDGNWIVFPVREKQGQTYVYMMSVSGGEPRRITQDGCDYIQIASLSPDISTVLYGCTDSEGRRRIIASPTLGGPGRTILEGAIAASFFRDGKHVRYLVFERIGKSRLTIQLWSMTVDGTDRKLLVADTLVDLPNPRFASSWSPDESRFAWVRNFPDKSTELIVKTVVTGEERQLTFDKKFVDDPAWAFNDMIIFSSNRGGNVNLWMIPAAGGEPVQLTRGPGPDYRAGISSDGKRLVYAEQPWVGQTKCARLDDGKVEEVPSDQSTTGSPSVSPSGRFVVSPQIESHADYRVTNDIVLFDRRRGIARKLTNDNDVKSFPFISPDEKWITYSARRISEPAESLKVYLLEIENPVPRMIGKGTAGIWFSEGAFTVRSTTHTYTVSLDRDDRNIVSPDSTLMYPVLGGRSVLIVDMHQGRQGLWLALSRTDPQESVREAKLLIKSLPLSFRIAQQANEVFYIARGTFDLRRVSMANGADRLVPHKFPGLGGAFDVRSDGKEIVYTDAHRKTRFVVIENLFE